MKKESKQLSKKITKMSVVEQVCASIKNSIAAGLWKEGDKLPSEAELASEFGVNRLSVRMAIQKLNTLGITETRTGEGTFVLKFSLKSVLSEITVFYEDEDRVKDVQQLRKLLECECIKLVISNSTKSDQKALKKALDTYKACSEFYFKNIEDNTALLKLVEADFNFHYQIVKISGNKLYKDIYYMVQQLIRDHIIKLQMFRMRRRCELGLSPLEENEMHNKIYNCIINADLDGIEKNVDEMLALTLLPEIDVF